MVSNMGNFCPKCGTAVTEVMLFCPGCGFSLKQAPVAAPAVEKTAEMVTPMVEETAEIVTPMVEETAEIVTPMVEETAEIVTPIATDNVENVTSVAENIESEEIAQTQTEQVEEAAAEEIAPAMDIPAMEIPSMEKAVDEIANEYMKEETVADCGGIEEIPPIELTMAPPAKKPVSKMAVFSLIFGILSLLCCCFGAFGCVMALLSVIFAIIALFSKKRGKAMAVIGLICGLIGLALSAYMVMASYVNMPIPNGLLTINGDNITSTDELVDMMAELIKSNK